MQDLHDQINEYQRQLDKGLEFQELMKQANVIVKKHEAQKLERGLANKELVALGLTYDQAEKVLTPDFVGRKGFPQYKLTNNNANNKRLKDRIEQIKTKLQGAKAVKNTGQAEEYVFDGGTIEVNYEIDRVQILFPGGRVDKELFKKLRSNGYVYSPTNQAFQRKITPQAIRNAIYLFDAKKVATDEVTETEMDEMVERGTQGLKGDLPEVTFENETPETDETKTESELNPRDSWYIKTQGTPYGIDRALLSLVKNGNNEVFEKDFKQVMSNPNYNTKEKFREGINDEQTDILQKINKKEKEVNEWVERGGPHLKKLPKYDEWQNDIKALKILENHLSVLDAIAEHYFDEIAEINETEETKIVSTHYDKLKEIEGKKVQLPQSIWDVISQLNHVGSKIERADIWNEYRSLTLPIIKKTLWQIALDKPYTEVFKTGKEKLISFGGFDLLRAIKSAYAEQDLEISDKTLKPVNEVISDQDYTPIKQIKGLIDAINEAKRLTNPGSQYMGKLGIIKWIGEDNDNYEIIYEADYIVLMNKPNLAKGIKFYGWYENGKNLTEKESKMQNAKATSETYLEPNTPDEFDEVIFDHLDEIKSAQWIGNMIKQRIILKEIYSELNGPELEKHKEVERLFKAFYEREKDNPEYNGTTELKFDPVHLWITEENPEKTPVRQATKRKDIDNDIDPDYDLEQGKKFKEVIKLDRPGFEKKFGIAVMGWDQYKLYITFKDKSTGELDLSRNARMGNYTPPAFDKLQDVQYWLRNATQYLYEQPDLILANLKTTNREWTSHPKGYAKGIIAPKLSELKKYKVGDILVAKRNIEKPNKFSIFYQKGERVKIDKISDLPSEITTYIVENMDYMGNNEKEFYNALPETYLNDNFENQQPMEIKEKVATSNLKPGDLIMINNVKYKVQGIKDERLLVTNLSDTAIPNRTDDFNLEYALANYSKIDDMPNKTIANSYTPDRIENRLLNPKGIQAFLTKKYDNQYQLNKGIEEFMTNKGAEPTTYTTEEKFFIKKYSGYGGLSKFGTAGKGAFFEYYTPTPVIRKMWALAYKYGYKGGSILESSVGTGEFLALAPTDASITAYEINPFSADICRILYPQAKVFTQPFEKNFIENNFTIKDRVTPLYDLCIGNCPYGSFEVVQSRYLSGMGELKHVQAKNYAEYFLRRSLDLLKPGGLLILIIGADVVNGGKLFLDSDISPVKEYLAEHSDLLDAYRLPDSVFERTQVTTEIVVIQKK